MPKIKPRAIRKTVHKAKNYAYPDEKLLLRPDVGVQSQFKKKKPPKSYRYDSSLAPELIWDGKNGAREEGERLIREIIEAKTIEEARSAATRLKKLSRPFLNWAGKAERLSFDVPTLPLFVHERLSTQAILETLKGHRSSKAIEFDFFGDPRHSIADQTLRAYEYADEWRNRMILGDSLVVMNSLLEYEGMGGKVQMIYIDPPYGVKFGSNFQPFIRKRNVEHGDDDDMTREPEMVQAYRDTWEMGLHSYLTYMRDRLLVARDLLSDSGSVFVQISDENLHHVREVMDEVFGAENFVSVITVQKTESQTSGTISSISDYLVWYAKEKDRIRYRQLFLPKEIGGSGATGYTYLESPDGTTYRSLTAEEKEEPNRIPIGWKLFDGTPLVSQSGGDNAQFPVELDGKSYTPGHNFWKTNLKGFEQIKAAQRLVALGSRIEYKRYFNDFPVYPLANLWIGLGERGFVGEKLYVVQTAAKVIQRCLLMTTDPGDLVLDPTCGSGTTAYVAEQWGRRWITIDTSRVPLALARQRLLTATFPWYDLKDDSRGPIGGFTYVRKQNKKGEEVGGIVPHITLKSIANNEPPSEEVLVDRPQQKNGITRVSGPFCFEATIPTPTNDTDESSSEDSSDYAAFVDRMIEILRKSPIIRVDGNKTVTFSAIRQPAKTLSLSAEGLVKNGSDKPVAFLFGPENGAVSEKLVYDAGCEARAKSYSHLYVIGFAIQPKAREFVAECEKAVGIPATYVQATPDLMMGDLLKNMRSSQIFSVCGLPEIKIHTVSTAGEKEKQYQVELLGFDVFDPATMETEHRRGDDVPAWLLDTNYNGLSFHVNQAFFPRTSAWEGLKKALRADYESSVWDHLGGTKSAPFEVGEHKQVAVKVIDDRGNELTVTKSLAK